MSDHPFDFKGEMTLLNVLQLRETDLQDIEKALSERSAGVGGLLKNTPLIVDVKSLLGNLSVSDTALDFTGLRDLLIEYGFMPVGIRHVDEAQREAAQTAGWVLLPAGRAAPPLEAKGDASGDVSDVPAATDVVQMSEQSSEQSAAACTLKLIDRPVRSGQQVYNPHGDIVVLRHTSAASELLANGSVHVYGALRGRVLAGVQGDTTARIFCQQLEAELVSIAGCYRLLEEEDMPLKGQAVMISLQADKLIIEPMT